MVWLSGESLWDFRGTVRRVERPSRSLALSSPAHDSFNTHSLGRDFSGLGFAGWG